MSAFRLSKWYLDCVTGSGDASIAYTGVLEWRFLHFGFSSLLESTGTQVRQQNMLRDQHDPRTERDSISWKMPKLGIDALWRADAAAVHQTIFECEEGAIDWHCIMPRARAEFGDRRGLGYVEHLTMTIPPWKIPIRQLRWGRFLTADDWIVWIDWDGEFSRRIVYRNGVLLAVSSLEDCKIELASRESLTMSNSIVLREGPLGSTALASIPGVENTFPGRLLRVNECKWRSRARLAHADGRTSDGWAIHERVVWPQ